MDDISAENAKKKTEEGLSTKELIMAGFSLEKRHKLGAEFHAEATDEIKTLLKENNIDKTWGFEGLITSYAQFTSDNPDHPDYGKQIISIYSNDEATDEMIDEAKKLRDNALEKNINQDFDKFYKENVEGKVGEQQSLKLK